MSTAVILTLIAASCIVLRHGLQARSSFHRFWQSQARGEGHLARYVAAKQAGEVFGDVEPNGG